MPHVLPADWQDIIQRVSTWLTDATTDLDRRESEFLLRFPADHTPRVNDAPTLTSRLNQLPAKLLPLDAAVKEADAAADEAEDALRNVARRSETLRIRLAEWVGRAIG